MIFLFFVKKIWFHYLYQEISFFELILDPVFVFQIIDLIHFFYMNFIR